jgi:uncharacterized protein YkvS
MSKNTEYLNANLRTAFADVLRDRTLKQGEKVDALIELVDGMLGDVAGVSFNGVNGAVRTEFRNDRDLDVNYDANERIESIDFNRPGMTDFHFYA